MSRVSTSSSTHAAAELVEKVSWYCALAVALLLLLSICGGETAPETVPEAAGKGRCDEIYVVREGETLQTISEKCGDPFIVEENPHIHDPDDVFPGLVLKITPFYNL
ncbi:hypothetical protein DM860_010414 [Cuscuta australis]|uniref:LysM domain-containing protein n=1 Tax=Cuscuta australis TaxID=267555 RepID=A0A328E2R0_9ASTE|nr:hypothetical protein DM860_010414 [Cuscuta australis]